jgi:hypothetical protein
MSPHHSSDDGQVKKKKKHHSHTEDGVAKKKKKKKKRRSPEEEYLREAARRKCKQKLADFDAQAAGLTKSSRSKSRRRTEDPGLSEQRIQKPIRMEDEGQADTRMAAFSTTRQMSRQLQPDEVNVAFGMSSQDVEPSYGVQQQEINWETGEGLNWPDDNDVTPLTAFDTEPTFREEPTLREDVEDPFVPMMTSFSGGSPGGQPGRVQWQTEQETEQGPETDDPFSSRPGAHPVNPTYQAPLSRYSNDRSRRSSTQGMNLRSSSLRSEKRRNTLPLGLYPIAETGEPPEKKKENGPLALFPVDECYDGGTATKEKGEQRLSYSSTGESYAQFETEDATPGGTYVASRRISNKRRREKERGNGPSYFRSSERYDDENLLADSFGRAYDMESQALGEDRLGAFAVRRSGTNPSEDSERLLMEHPSDGLNRSRRSQRNGVVHVDAEELDDSSSGKNRCACNIWLKLLVAFLLLAGIAVAIAIPLTLSNNDSSSNLYSQDEIAARKEQLLGILEGVSDPSALADESSPQYAACEWMASEDMMSPLNNGLLSSGISELILQRYALAVFYYSTTGESWFSSEGWLDGQKEECLWQFIECVNEDVVSIDTGPRNNLVGDLQPELKELKELRKCSYGSMYEHV